MPAPSYANYVIQGDGYRWGADKGVALGAAVTITYSFPTENVHNLTYAGITQVSETQKEAARAAFEYIASFTKITFVETTANAGNLQFLNGDLGAGGGGEAPNSSYGSGGYAWGVVVMNNKAGWRLDDNAYIPGEISNDDIGGAAWQTYIHEIAHTLGLKHPHQANAAGDANSIMPASMDNLTQSSMSYTAYGHSDVTVKNVAPAVGFTSNSLKPSTFGITDIAALQYLYGTNTSSAGNETYTFLPDKPVYMTISDNGPNNTIDVSKLTGSNRIDLTPGTFSDLAIKGPYADVAGATAYDGTRALAIAYGVNVANVLGGSGADHITGNAIANTIVGGAGVDTMAGGAGADTYWVDNAGDVVTETGAGGTVDRVFASVSYALGAGQQIDLLATNGVTKTTAINLTGNEFAQTLQGNAGRNVLVGGGGADTMAAYGGADDYWVDNAGDVVTETGAGGTVDRVFSSVSYALAAGQQIDVLATNGITKTAAINLTGNDLAQALQGNAGANVLAGRGGGDALFGFGGADRLYGGLGNDKLDGGAGNDVFVFDTSLNAATNVDTINAYSVAADTIWLDDAVFLGLARGGLSAAAFTTGAAATDGADRIVYNGSTGALLFDRDGSGSAYAAVQFAKLAAGLAMAAGEFAVV